MLLITLYLYFADYLRPFLNHPFQNVRERLGSILINIFEVDLVFKESNSPECPRIKDFIGEVMEKIVILNEDYPEAIASTGEGNFGLCIKSKCLYSVKPNS